MAGAILAVVEYFALDGLVGVVAILLVGAAKVRLLEQQLQFVRLHFLLFLFQQFLLAGVGWRLVITLRPTAFVLQSVILSRDAITEERKIWVTYLFLTTYSSAPIIFL